MLIDFSVENFRSFREKQVFSMEAAPRLQKRLNVMSIKIKGRSKALKLLRTAAIYGPNASGKSNLVIALNTLNEIITNEISASNNLPIASFRFDALLKDKPSNFQINFISSGNIYKYELSATAERIHYEALFEESAGNVNTVYKRFFENGKEDYEFPSLEGDETLHNAWANLTNPKQTFIGQAATNSKETLRQLKIPFDWLKTNLRRVPKDLSDLVRVLQLVHQDHPDLGTESEIATFLSELDIPISEIDFSSATKNPSPEEVAQIFNDSSGKKITEAFNKNKVTLKHKTALGEATFTFREESEGTKNLSGFHLLWTLLTRNTNFKAVAFDELDSSLHPKIIEKLIKQFVDKECNSQLIFTTHNTHLMDSKLLRRDQFWLTERDNNGATQITSIYDYVGRESEDIEKRYFEGRYRGLPNINIDDHSS